MKHDLSTKAEERRTRIIDKGGDKTKSKKLKAANRKEKEKARGRK